MNNTSPQSRQCLGRNRNLRRCARQVEKGFFCYDHKFQPLILFSFIIFTAGVAIITYFSFFQSFQKDESAESNKERDVIIAKQYRIALNVFLAKFRIYLVCLPDYKSLDKDIIEVFDPDHLTKAVQVSKITPELIEKLFTFHDFSKPVGDNCHFESNKQPVTTSDLFLYEIRVLNKGCSNILLKYASAGQPKLINKIEVMKNRTDNLIGPYGPKNFSQFKRDDLHWISEFFCQIKQSYEYINKIIPN